MPLRHKKMKRRRKKRTRSSGLPGGAGPPTAGRTRMAQPGFEYGGSTFYSELSTEATSRTLKYANPVSGSDLINPGGTVIFDFTLGKNEWARFLEKPLIFDYQVKIKNPNYDANSGDNKVKTEWWYVNKEDHPGIQMNVNPGVSIWIDRATISLDNQIITDGLELGSHSGLYKAFNKIISSEQDRRRDGVEHLQKCNKDRWPAETKTFTFGGENGAAPTTETITLEPTEAHRRAAGLVQNINYSTSTSHVVPTSLDGFPFLALPRNNALARLDFSSSENKQSFLVPSTRITIQLHLRSKLEAWIDHLNQHDQAYFSDTKPTAKLYAENVKVELQNVRLAYESFVPKTETMRSEIERHNLTIHYDIPYVNTLMIQENSQHCELKVHVPAGSRYMYAALAPGFTLWPYQGSNRHAKHHFVFPDKLTNLSIYLPSHGFLIHPNLGDLHGEGARKNVVLRNYVADLRTNNLIDDDFDTIFPQAFVHTTKGFTGSYLQILAIDLRPFKIREEVDLTVTATFNGDNPCPANLFFVSCFVRQGALTRSPDKLWKLSIVKPS